MRDIQLTLRWMRFGTGMLALALIAAIWIVWRFG
jgi:hypothetical protein